MYVQRFDWVKPTSAQDPSSQDTAAPTPDPVTGLYVLRRAARQSGGATSYFGDVLPVQNIRTPIQLVPRFGPKADARMTPQTSLERSTVFFLNRYSDKIIYFTVY